MTAPGPPSDTTAVRLTSGLPETVLPAEPEAVRAALAAGTGPAGGAPAPRRIRRGPRRSDVPRGLGGHRRVGP